MQYKEFKDIRLSRLGMGNMRLPEKGLGKKIDRKRAQEIIDYAMSNGINYYDTAYIYNNGDSERFLGEALTKYPRDSYYLATKFYIGTNPDYKAVFEEQLRRLQTDYIDFYLIHSVMDSNANRYMKSGCISYFLEQKKKGRIRYLGFSSHSSPECLEHFSNQADWDFAQIQLNYFDWMYGTAKQEYEILTKKKIPIMVMESIRGGKLSKLNTQANAMLKQREPERSISSWALRFLMALPNVQVILSGMSTLEQIQDNVSTFEEDCALTAEEIRFLLVACNVFHKGVAVPCTGCRYCQAECPKHLEIPSIMNLYNTYKTEGEQAMREQLKETGSEGIRVDCIGCRACERHCPQKIKISEIMKDAARIIG